MIKQATNDIAHWLNSHVSDYSDYHTGLMLLESYGNNTSLLSKLKIFKDEKELFNAIKALWLTLRKQAAVAVVVASSTEALAEVMEQAKENDPIRLSAKNAINLKLQAEWKALRKKAGAWQVQLYWIGRTEKGIGIDLNREQKEQRALLAKQIMDTEKRIIEIQTDINYLSIHGKLPTKEKVLRPKKKIEFDYQLYENTRKKIHTAKGNVTLYTQKLNDAHIDDIAKLNSKIDTWQVKLLDLEILFAALKKAKP